MTETEHGQEEWSTRYLAALTALCDARDALIRAQTRASMLAEVSLPDSEFAALADDVTAYLHSAQDPVQRALLRWARGGESV